jgi:tagatose-6-phosphate ketose/aldose isomerase
MNPLLDLIALGAPEKARLGVEATPAEIAQQPEMWRDTARRFAAAAPQIRALLSHLGLPGSDAEVVFSGAGTSDFVGRCAVGPVGAALKTRAIACPTTDIVTHPDYAFPSDRPAVMVSVARSGNSPESVAAVEIALRERPHVRHLMITCNDEGALARLARAQAGQAYSLVLNPRTNDRGLAMTSSFTSMVIASLGLAHLDDTDGFVGLVDPVADAGERVLGAAPDACAALAERRPKRACFVGSGALIGAAVESHLKLQEMTDGGVICLWDTFLGLRHGPRAAIHGDTLVVYYLSSDRYVRRYELDLIRSNRAQGLGMAHLVVVDRKTSELADLADHVVEYDPQGKLTLPDHMISPVVTVVGQLLGLFASLEYGFKPDAPSAGGVISRVVEGVTIYPHDFRPKK